MFPLASASLSLEHDCVASSVFFSACCPLLAPPRPIVGYTHSAHGMSYGAMSVCLLAATMSLTTAVVSYFRPPFNSIVGHQISP